LQADCRAPTTGPQSTRHSPKMPSWSWVTIVWSFTNSGFCDPCPTMRTHAEDALEKLMVESRNPGTGNPRTAIRRHRKREPHGERGSEQLH
jgi:hypothetical protein